MEFNFSVVFFDQPVKRDFIDFISSFKEDEKYIVPENSSFIVSSYVGIVYTHDSFYLRFVDNFRFLYKMPSSKECDVEYIWRAFLDELENNLDRFLSKLIDYVR